MAEANSTRNPAPRAAGAACPVCGIPAVSSVTREDRGINIADFLCARDHAWHTTWLAGVAA